MKNYISILQQSPLFFSIEPDDIHSVLNCLSPRQVSYIRGSFVHHYGDQIDSLGIVLSGSIHVLKEDFWGNANLLVRCLPGDIFGESSAIRSSAPLEVSILAADSSDILFLNISQILTFCSSACHFHSQLISNLLSVLTEKNFQLAQKLEHVTKRTTREKLLSYLSSESKHQKNSSFVIPFNRQQLADYLSVDRSAMSNELSKLQSDGVLTFHKNAFTLLRDTSREI